MAITCAGIVLSTAIGTVIGLEAYSLDPSARRAMAYVEAIRNVPLLLQLYLWLAVLTELLPADSAAPALLPGLFLSKSGLHFPVIAEKPVLPMLAVMGGGVAAMAYRGFARRRQAQTGKRYALWPVAVLVLGPAAVLLAPTLATVPLDLPMQRRFGFVGGGTLTPELTALLIGLSLYNGAFVAEILRGAIRSVAPGQGEAAAALGLQAAEGFASSSSRRRCASPCRRSRANI